MNLMINKMLLCCCCLFVVLNIVDVYAIISSSLKGRKTALRTPTTHTLLQQYTLAWCVSHL